MAARRGRRYSITPRRCSRARSRSRRATSEDHLGTGETGALATPSTAPAFTNQPIQAKPGLYWPTLDRANPLDGTAVSRIAVDPTNEMVYAATSDQAVNSNPGSGTAGVWRFNGTTWVNLTAITSTVRNGILPAPNGGFQPPPGYAGSGRRMATDIPKYEGDLHDLQFGMSTTRSESSASTVRGGGNSFQRYSH